MKGKQSSMKRKVTAQIEEVIIEQPKKKENVQAKSTKGNNANTKK
jgi:hypothetical protein